MNFDTLYKAANLSVIPAWLLLVLAPQSRLTKWIVYSPLYPLLMGGAYVYFLFSNPAEGGGMGSLEELRIGFTSDSVLLAAWMHYLIFDMFVGAWIARDAQQKGIPHWVIIIPLFFTLMLGPVGLGLYLLLRMALRKEVFR